MTRPDVLLVSLGGTTGLREADGMLAASLRRAGASVVEAAARPPREVRTFALTDLGWARAARAAAAGAPDARSVIYSSTTAALLWPRPGAIRFDAPAAGNRPGRHGIWQRPLERRRLREAPLLVPWSQGAIAEAPAPRADAVVVPVPVTASGKREARRDIAAATYGANPHKKGLDRVLAAWAQARRGDEQLVVAGVDEAGPAAPGVRYAGSLTRAEFRGLLRRTRVFVSAPRREDYGIAQLEALADGCLLVAAEGPGPFVSLPLARALDPRLVVSGADGLAAAIRAALDEPSPGYAERAADALQPFSPAAVDRLVAEELLPRLLG